MAPPVYTQQLFSGAVPLSGSAISNTGNNVLVLRDLELVVTGTGAGFFTMEVSGGGYIAWHAILANTQWAYWQWQGRAASLPGQGFLITTQVPVTIHVTGYFLTAS